MKDKNKTIEEMAKIMEECCNVFDENGRHIRNKCNPYDCECYSETNDVCCSFGMKQATALYNAGYRKVNEGDKVLTKEEYEEFIEASIWLEFRKGDLIEEVKEGTAREILQELYDEATRYIGDIVELTAFEIKQLAEKYGVEVE